MKLHGLSVIALGVVLAAIALPPSASPQTRTDMLLGGGDSGEDPLLSALNGTRKLRGVEPLSVHPLLTAAAERLAEDAGYEDWSEGDPLEGLVPRARAKEEMTVQGYEAARFGVALALSGESEQEVLRALIGEVGEDSEAKLISAGYRDVGLGRSWVSGTPFYVVLVAREQVGEAQVAAATAQLEDLVGLRKEVLKKVNKARKGAKRPIVKPSRCLDLVALNYARDMLERGWYGHVSPEGHDAMIRVTGGHCLFRSAAEVIARGVFTADEALEEWLTVPEEKEVLLDRRYSEAGFGLAYGQTDEGLQVFWALVYGSQEGLY